MNDKEILIQEIDEYYEQYNLDILEKYGYAPDDDDEYEYDLISSVEGRKTYKGKYSDFVYQPDEEGNPPEDRFGWTFLEYSEENIGCEYYEEPYESEYDEDDAENE